MHGLLLRALEREVLLVGLVGLRLLALKVVLVVLRYELSHEPTAGDQAA